MAADTLILLDLEETVIQDWDDPTILDNHIHKINRYLGSGSQLRSTEVGLMSWAVWDDQDKEIFERDIRKPIEDYLYLPFSHVWSMHDWAEMIFKARGLRIDTSDLFDFLRKPEVLFMLLHSPIFSQFNSITLIDDAIAHGTSVHTLGYRVLRLVNIKEL